MLPELWVAAAFLFVGLGIEPTTFGLKVRRTPYPSVSRCHVLRGIAGVPAPLRRRSHSPLRGVSPPALALWFAQINAATNSHSYDLTTGQCHGPLPRRVGRGQRGI